MVVIVATAEAADAVSHDDDEDGFQYLLLYVRYVRIYSRKRIAAVVSHSDLLLLLLASKRSETQILIVPSSDQQGPTTIVARERNRTRRVKFKFDVNKEIHSLRYLYSLNSVGTVSLILIFVLLMCCT